MLAQGEAQRNPGSAKKNDRALKAAAQGKRS